MRIHTSFNVERVIVLGFLLTIMAGALLLWLSNNFIYNMPLSPLDAFFMSTSAVCVTGLATVDISVHFGLISQIILLILIQIGGLGIITAVMLVAVAMGRRVGIRGRIFFLGGFGVDGVQGAVRLLYSVVKYTLFWEAAGSVFLFAGFMLSGESFPSSFYLAVFHGISAFCNAGFSTCQGGLHNYTLSPLVQLPVMFLIVFGGLGFPVYSECASCFKNRGSHRKLSLYPKFVLVMTALLIVFGALFFMASDWGRGLRGLPCWAKVMNSFFASVTTRTAGFDTIAPSAFSELGRVVMGLLMIIGASPASTGGGAKTTTFGVLGIAVWSDLHTRSQTTFLCHSISPRTVRRALAIIVLYLMTIFVGSVALAFIEQKDFAQLMFEAISALGTVGLSLGVTPELTEGGKIIITVLMFWGRVGLFTFFSTLVRGDDTSGVEYPTSYIPVG